MQARALLHVLAIPIAYAQRLVYVARSAFGEDPHLSIHHFARGKQSHLLMLMLIIGGLLPDPASMALAAPSGLIVESALQLNATTVDLGQTVSGTVTFRNSGKTGVTIRGALIAGRRPDNLQDNWPMVYDATTIPAGNTLTVTATRAIDPSEPLGTWQAFSSWQDAAGRWHESTPVAFNVAVASATASPSGEALPVGDLPGWRQIFSDDFVADVPLGAFPGSDYQSQWSMYPDGTPDTAGQVGQPSRYFPSKVVSIHNGVLDEYLHTEGATPMAAALLPRLPTPQTYGRYAVRFRADSLAGFKTAWLLWPDSERWPQDAEIDFPEGNLNSTFYAAMFPQGGIGGPAQDVFRTNTTYTSWHTAVIEWTPAQVTFLLDGQVIGTATSRIPNTPMHYVLQTEACLEGCPAAMTVGHLQVDWITIYAFVP